MATEAKPKGAVPEEAPCPPGAVVLDVFGEDGSPGKWEGRHGSVVFEPPAGERWREFLRITAVQQTLVLFLGSLAYDAGSIAYLVDLLPASIFFLLASGLFVVGLALDIRQLKEQQAEARESDPEVAEELLRNMWRRYFALALNLAGGAVSIIASVEYLRVSQEITTYQGNEAELRTGDIEFAVGIWLFSAGTAFLVYDMRATVLAICKLQGRPAPPWREDKTLQVLLLYSASLILFGIASTLYTLPGDTSQTVGVALFVVSNVSVTSINCVGLWYLWRAHCEEWDVQWLHNATMLAIDAMEEAHQRQREQEQGEGDMGEEDERQPHSSRSAGARPLSRSSSAVAALMHLAHQHSDDMAGAGAGAAASESGDDGEDGPPSIRSSLGDETPRPGQPRRYRVSLTMTKPSTPRQSLAHIEEVPVVAEGTRHALASAGLLPSARLSKARLSRVASLQRTTSSPRAPASLDGGTPPQSRGSGDGDTPSGHQQRGAGGGATMPPSSSRGDFGVASGRLSQVDSDGEGAPESKRGEEGDTDAGGGAPG